MPSPQPLDRSIFERELLSSIPAVTRKTCRTEDVFDPANTDVYSTRLWVRAQVRCTTSGGAKTVKYQSIDPRAVTPWFASVITDALSAEARPGQADRNCPDEGTYTNSSSKHGHPVGQYACFTGQSDQDINNGALFAEYEWTDTKLGIAAFASDRKNDADALIAWFRSPRSGPIHP